MYHIQKGDEKIKIDFGCGNRKREGFIGVDIRETDAVDVVIKPDEKLPFKDSSVDYIFCDNVLEHIIHLDFVLSEFYRISKHGCILEVIVPHFSVSQQEYHIRTFRFRFFDVHCIDKPVSSYPKYFCCISREFLPPKRWKWLKGFLDKHPNLYENTPLRSFLFVGEVRGVFKVIKE